MDAAGKLRTLALVSVVITAVAVATVGVTGVAAAAGNTLVVDADGSGDFQTVSAAVSAASDGDTIEIGPGTYTEQVYVDKDVRLVGAGQGETVIESPADLSASFDYPNHAGDTEVAKPVVLVENAAADVSSLTVDGAGQGDTNRYFFGVAYANSSGTVDNVTVTGVRESPLSGNQHGVAVAHFNLDGGERTFTLRDSTLVDYQKNGFVARGKGLTARVVGNEVTGAGPTSTIGQNGVQIGGSAVGHIEDNVVRGHDYVNPGEPPVGTADVILYGHSSAETTVVRDNTLTDSEIGVAVAFSGTVEITDNDFGDNLWHVLDFNTDSLDAATIFAENTYDRAAYPANGTDAVGRSVYGGIQRAINRAEAGDTVRVGPGTYDERVTVNRSIALVAPNGATVTHEPAGQSGKPTMAVTTNGSTVRGFTVTRRAGPDRGTKDWVPFAQGIRVSASNVTVANTSVTGHGLDEGQSAGIMVLDDESGNPTGEVVTNVTVTHNAVSGFATPFAAYEAYGGQIDGVTVTRNSATGNDIPAVLVAGAGVTAPGYEVVLRSPNGDYYVRNESAAVAATAHVDATTIENTTSGEFLVRSGMRIQDAIDAAEAGDTIDVGPGRFAESDVVVDTPVTIEGAGMNRTVVDAGNSSADATEHVFVVRSNRTTISGLTMTDGHDAIRIGQGAHVEDFALVDTRVNESNIGIYVAGNAVDDANGEFDGVRFENTHWIDNRRKAIYVEKLSNATFEDLYIDGVSGPDYGFVGGIDINLKGGTYTNVTIRDSVVQDVAAGDPYDGVAAFSTAIAVKGRDDSSYSGNPGYLDGLTIDNVTVADSFNGLRIGEPGKTLSTPENVTVTDSTFRNNTGYHLVDLTGTPLEVGAVVRDNDFQSGGYVGSGARVSNRLQQVVDSAETGDVVTVLPGTYDGALNLENASDLTIRGTDGGPVVLEPTETVGWAVDGIGTSRTAAVRVVNSENVTIEGLHADFGRVADPNGVVAGVLFWNSSGTLQDNTFRNMSTSGYYELTTYIRAPGYTDADRATVLVADNVFRNTGRQGVATHGYVNATIANNEFHSADRDFGYAVEVGSESTGAVVGNEIHGYADPAASDGSEAAGVYVENAFTTDVGSSMTKRVVVVGNDIYGNQIGVQFGQTYDGLSANVGIDATFANNHVHDNTEAGVTVVDENAAAGSSVTVHAAGNTVENNSRVGYHVFTEADDSSVGDGDIELAVRGGRVSGHETGILIEDGGVASDSTIDVSVHGTDLSGNAVAINNTWEKPVNATSNYWGAPSGPGGAASGFGAPVSGSVHVRPFYTDRSRSSMTRAVGHADVENDTASVGLSSENVGAVDVSLPPKAGASSVAVTESDAPTGESTAPESDVVTYLDIDASDDVSQETRVTVTVSRSALQARNIAPSDAVLLHYTGGSWTELETDATVQGQVVRLSGTANGLSPFAIARAAPDPTAGDGESGGDGGDGSAGSVDRTGGDGADDSTPARTQTSADGGRTPAPVVTDEPATTEPPDGPGTDATPPSDGQDGAGDSDGGDARLGTDAKTPADSGSGASPTPSEPGGFGLVALLAVVAVLAGAVAVMAVLRRRGDL